MGKGVRRVPAQEPQNTRKTMLEIKIEFYEIQYRYGITGIT